MTPTALHPSLPLCLSFSTLTYPVKQECQNLMWSYSPAVLCVFSLVANYTGELLSNTKLPTDEIL